MSKIVKMKMNASEGRVDLKCSEDFFEEAMGKCIELLSNFQMRETHTTPEVTRQTPKKNGVTETVIPDEDKTIDDKPKRQRSSAGKPASYVEVDLNLSDEQCRELKDFYLSKNPKKQNDIVAVATVKIREMTGKKDYTVDELYSALRLIGGIKTPKNLTAVINNMYKLGLSDRRDGKLVVNYATEDRVNLQLSETVEEK